MSTIFKVGQEVFCGLVGNWGKVVKIITGNFIYPIKVQFTNDDNYRFYTNDGRIIDYMPPTLSFTAYKIEGVNQNIPRKAYAIGDKVYDLEREWGEVIKIDNETEGYPITVNFYINNLTGTYTADGLRYNSSKHPRLSYTKYDLTNGGFS